MSDELHRMVGETLGKVDSLTKTVERYIEAHDKRHEKIDEALGEHAEDINRAKGAKGVILWLAGGVAAAVGAIATIAAKTLGLH